MRSALETFGWRNIKYAKHFTTGKYIYTHLPNANVSKTHLRWFITAKSLTSGINNRPLGDPDYYPEHSLRNRTDISDDLALWNLANTPVAPLRASKLPTLNTGDHAKDWMLQKVAVFTGQVSQLIVDKVLELNPLLPGVPKPVKYQKTLEFMLDGVANSAKTVAIPITFPGSADALHSHIKDILQSLRSWMIAPYKHSNSK